MKGADSDASLVARCKRELPHKYSAFEELVGKYKNAIFTLCYRMVGNPSDAEDLMQEVFMRAFGSLRAFEGRSTLSTWLYSIAHNRCVEFLVKRSKDATRDLSFAQAGARKATPDVSEKSMTMESILLRLEEEQRSVLVMKYVMDLDIKEIAEALNVSQSAVKMRLSRAREELRSLYLEKS